MTSCLCFCSIQTDAWFELISVVMDMAIWHTKHAAVIAASDRWAICCHRNSNQLYSYHFLLFHIPHLPISPSHFTYLTLPFHISHPPISHPSPSHFTSLILPFSISLDQAKDVHRSLKVAAGMFLHVKDSLLPKLPASTEKGTDFDPRVVEAYANQSQAEAQEGKCTAV